MKTRSSILAVVIVVGLLYAGIGISLASRTISGNAEPPSSKPSLTDFAVRQVHKFSNANANGIADPACDDIWTATSITNAPTARGWHTAVWTATEMIIWGGAGCSILNGSSLLNTGGRYNPTTDTWTATSTTNAPAARYFHTAVWTGSELIVWGGSGNSGDLNTGARYNPSTDTWTAISTLNAPSGRYAHTAVWTGSEMIVWGGYSASGPLNTGARYNPSTDTWTAISTSNAPAARYDHTAVWTGNEMVVWGGFNPFINKPVNTGGRYNPSTDTWTATAIINAPDARYLDTAVWTGSDMIIWGGYRANGSDPTNTGGRYNPSTDTWTPLSTANAPAARADHKAVWTGSEMIVWAGGNGSIYPEIGGRYSPSTNAWTPISATNAPDLRERFTAVWTGSEMIVWGGWNQSLGCFNTGGRYCAVSQASPTPTPTLGNYPDTSLRLSSDATVVPSAAPTNTTSISVSTSTNFKGKLEADPNTGSVRVTDAHPAGTYTVTVTAFNDSNGPTTTKTFTLTVTTPPTCNPVSFAPAANFGVGTRPSQVVVGDFNGDGKQDLAVADSNNVSIWLGNGAGSFSVVTQLATTGSMAVGDFNGDGKQDLAIAYSINPPILSGKVAIFLGDGAGNFTAAGNFDTGRFPFSVAVGDFNRDGKQDLAVACYASDSVSILLGDGLGSFGAANNFGVSSGPQFVAVGDFNGDGKQDLAVACIGADKVSILLGDGGGSFGAAASFNAGATPRDVVVGDFNGDGKHDLAVPNVSANTVSVLLGDGAGGFGTPTSFAVGSGPYSIIAVGDFNGDGKQDLAVPNVTSANVSILLGDGVGGFGSAINLSVDLAPFAVAVGDFNGDGMQDMATANLDSNNVSILLRDCAPTETQINNLITSINNSALIPAGNKTSLNAKLQAALAALQSGNIATACTKLQDSLNELRAQRGKKIPVDLADALANNVIEIRAELGCG